MNRLIVRSLKKWRQEARATRRWLKEEDIPKRKRDIDEKIARLKSEIDSLKRKKRDIKVPKLDLSKSAYDAWVLKNKIQAEERGMELAIDDDCFN